MAGIMAYGTYVPHWRLDRRTIAEALGAPAGRGTRAVASFDEDTTSMGVEAARAALAAAPPGYLPEVLLLATASPAYLDKTNATAIHAALDLPESSGAYDIGGAPRSAAGALRLAAASPLASLVVCSDIRTGLPGGKDETEGGDAAVAFAFSAQYPPLLDLVGHASSSGEFLERWRTPGDAASRVWEDRFGEAAYAPLAQAALTDALKQAGLTADAVSHLVVAGLHARAVKALASWAGVPAERVADSCTSRIGNPAAAQPGLVLSDVLDRAQPGETIVVAHLADGADVAVYRATPQLEMYRGPQPRAVSDQIAAGRPGLSYTSYLTWRGLLRRDPPRRPEPPAPASPAARRREGWKFGLVASRCAACGTRHLPPSRVCLSCHSVGRMLAERMTDLKGTISSYSVDRLAFSPAPPVITAVIDFDGGGRFTCEMADAIPEDMAIGRRVEMTFRRMYTASNGAHNYFWKARLIREKD